MSLEGLPYGDDLKLGCQMSEIIRGQILHGSQSSSANQTDLNETSKSSADCGEEQFY